MTEPTARYRHQSLRGENTRDLSPDGRPKPRRESLLDKKYNAPEPSLVTRRSLMRCRLFPLFHTTPIYRTRKKITARLMKQVNTKYRPGRQKKHAHPARTNTAVAVRTVGGSNTRANLSLPLCRKPTSSCPDRRGAEHSSEHFPPAL